MLKLGLVCVAMLAVGVPPASGATLGGAKTASAQGALPATAGCTATVSSMSALSVAVHSASGGSVVCVAPGSYTGMSLGATHSSEVRVEPEPTLDPNGSGKVTIGLSSTLTDGFGNRVGADVAPNSTHITIHNFHFTGELSIGYGSSYINVSNNDMTEGAQTGGREYINFATSNCKAPNAPSWSNCQPMAPVSNVTISANNFHDNNQTSQNGGDDVLHTNNFRNLTITGNEFSHIVENNAGGHVDCLQNVFGGSGLTFAYNYEHDNECQGFFLKDGDITNVAFNQNLFVRDNMPATNGGSRYSSSQVLNTTSFTAQRNTIWDTKGFTLRCMTSSVPCSANINHNAIWVLNNGNIGDAKVFSMSESYNLFNTSPFTFSPGVTDVQVRKPAVMCGANCGNGTLAGDDYRLVSNAGNIGISWAPSQRTYGPTHG